MDRDFIVFFIKYVCFNCIAIFDETRQSKPLNVILNVLSQYLQYYLPHAYSKSIRSITL